MKISIFNPFKHIAGIKALAIGFPVIILSSILGYLSHTHFDGVIDAHVTDYGNIYTYISEGLINYIILLVLFYLAGVIVSGFHFRFVDMAGTIALSRVPLIIIPLVTVIFSQEKFSDYITYAILQEGHQVTITAFDVIGFIVSALVMLFIIIWVVALLFNAYKICVNKKGAKLIVSFIVTLLVAEIISKIIIINFIGNPTLTQFLAK